MTDRLGGPKGVGGWLILPAIALFLIPFRLGAVLFSDLLPVFQQGYWEILTTPGTEAYHPLWGPLILFELTGNLAFLAFDIALVVLLIKRSHRFPLMMITFLASNLLYVAGDFFLAGLIPAIAEQGSIESAKELSRTAIGAAVWIPYFLISKRVKNTFVRPEANAQLPETVQASAESRR